MGRILTLILSFFIISSSHADFNQFGANDTVNGSSGSGNPVGSMSVFDVFAGQRGGYLWNSDWGLADLQAITTDNRTFELAPNINCWNANDAYWVNNGQGNKSMSANTVWMRTIQSGDLGVSFTFNCSAFDLNNAYTLKAFVKILDQVGGTYSEQAIDQVAINSTLGSTTLSLNFANVVGGYEGQMLQVGWVVDGLVTDPAVVDSMGSATVTATSLFINNGDTTAPSPNPMTFSQAPSAVSDSTITMTATTATDDLSTVEYYFTCVSGGGNDSGWQTSPVYNDTGLAAGTSASYTVKARDTSVNNNETQASSAFSASTIAQDTNPPSPNPMTFASTDSTPTTITLTATPATDDSAVEYLFDCVSGDGADSEWQSSNVYVDTGLTPGTSYGYTVRARDLSSGTNMTAASSTSFINTDDEPALEANMSYSLTDLSGSSTDASIQAQLSSQGLDLGAVGGSPTIDFDANGAVFGAGQGYVGRQVVRTINDGFADISFEAYATFTFSGTTDEAAFMGMGQGIIATDAPENWGVPGLNLQGVNEVVAELKNELSYSPNQGVNILKITNGVQNATFAGDILDAGQTFRVKLDYDATTSNATFSVDYDYVGGAFVSDQELGTVNMATSDSDPISIWDGAPVRVYVGGGEGTRVSNFEIIADVPAPPVNLGGIAHRNGTAGLSFEWTGVQGTTYIVQYKTDLINDTEWTTDPSVGVVNATENGLIQVDSDLDLDTVFYRILTQ